MHMQAAGLPFWDETHDFEGWFLVGCHEKGLAFSTALQGFMGALQRQPCHDSRPIHCDTVASLCNRSSCALRPWPRHEAVCGKLLAFS